MERLRASAALARQNNVLSEFVKFGMVGTVGFVVDTGLLYLALSWGWGLYVGRIFSFLCAASVCWALNRRFTFKYVGSARRHHQWVKFVSVSTVGGGINLSVYMLLVSISSFVAANPYLGVAVGALAGMSLNFTLSRQMVFNDRTSNA